jgi:hypothetical protein
MFAGDLAALADFSSSLMLDPKNGLAHQKKGLDNT